jgi:hypothetical protein
MNTALVMGKSLSDVSDATAEAVTMAIRSITGSCCSYFRRLQLIITSCRSGSAAFQICRNCW